MVKGLRVAKKGKDASRGVGKDLAFTSEAQSLKINDEFKDIVRSFTVPSGLGFIGATVDISHVLAYAPVFRLFVETPYGSNRWYNDSNSSDLNDDINNVIQWKVIDINEARISIFFVVPDGGTVRYKYWLFEDGLRID